MHSALDDILVELSDFSNFLVQYQDNDFIFRQLLYLTRHLDFSDEVGRRQVMKLFRM